MKKILITSFIFVVLILTTAVVGNALVTSDIKGGFTMFKSPQGLECAMIVQKDWHTTGLSCNWEKFNKDRILMEILNPNKR